MSVASELMADPRPQDKQPASTDMDHSGLPVASPKGSPKGILRQRADVNKTAPKMRAKKASVVAFADMLGGDLAGTLVPEKTRSRDDWLWSVNKRRGASMIELFRAKELAEKSLGDATKSAEGKYEEGVWDVVLFKGSDDDSNDEDEDDEVMDEDEDSDEEEEGEEENYEEMDDAEGLEIVFEAWIDEDADDRTWADEGNEDEDDDMDDSSDDDDDEYSDQDDEDDEDADDATMTPSSSPGFEKSLPWSPVERCA
ncbi:hypothetical protein F5Y13DRAFT_58765 [Hypoxylon sp. FL1857]|nr:hypothetical protein F5Y13DRAFT_58765 [Hypoxylon sp. FL1857]